MKSFIVDRVGGDKPLQNDSQFTVYAGMSAAEADLPNLEEDSIVGVLVNPVIPPVTDPSDGSIPYYNDARGEFIPTDAPDDSNKVLVSDIDGTTGEISYNWEYKNNQKPVRRFATRSDALTAIALTPSDADYMPDGTIIIIEDEYQELEGEDR